MTTELFSGVLYNVQIPSWWWRLSPYWHPLPRTATATHPKAPETRPFHGVDCSDDRRFTMTKLEKLIEWEASLDPLNAELGDWVDGAAACTTTVGHVRAALAEVKQLRAGIKRIARSLREIGDEALSCADVADEFVSGTTEAPLPDQNGTQDDHR